MPNNLDIIKSTYEGSPEENARMYQTYLAEHAEWTEAAGFPYAGTYVGLNEIFSNVFQRIGSDWDGFNAKVNNYYDNGDTIIAVGLYSGVNKQTGKAFEADFVHIWQLESGKIIKFKQVVDSHLVWKAMSAN